MENIKFLKKLGDAGFQAALLANPQQALREVGVELPATTEVKVVRNSSKDDIYVVVPPYVEPSTGLSDDDLGKLAAGEIIGILMAITVIGTAVGVGAIGGAIVATGVFGGEIPYEEQP